MTDSFQTVKTLLRTEKGARLAGRNQYLFSVAKGANKIEIKKAVEEIYKVKVEGVNTQIVPGKSKRVRHHLGKTPEWKKAIVTLRHGHKIDLA
ncbi:MAG: 50S ribosomal protein L23 [Candidatus Omnitrophica bacterium]|nr:50S ribosomal protein L23 [Candidatus Omnitrophota bacterium]